MVRLLAVPETPMHWQNAFIGEEREVVEISHKKADNSIYKFYIDNQDGSGLRKIKNGGGPDSYSAHVDQHEYLRELWESDWQQWNPILHAAERHKSDEWQQKNFPEEFKRMESLRNMITNSKK